MPEHYDEEYEGEFDLEEAGYLDDADDEDAFDKEYERIFSDDAELDEDVKAYERDAVTGRRAKRSRMSVLNKSKLSKHEMDELFLD